MLYKLSMVLSYQEVYVLQTLPFEYTFSSMRVQF